MLNVASLRTEYLENPTGIDAKQPRLSWKILGDRKNIIQKAYQIEVSRSKNFDRIIWDSGKVETDQSQGVLYCGPQLDSMERVYWRVKVWSNYEESAFSEPAYFEMGLLKTSDWKAKWIEPEEVVDPDAYKPAPYIRKEFFVKEGLVSARAYFTAKGLYKFYINGTEGTDWLFTPGFTSYYKRLQYQTYDITSLLQKGINALGVILGDGWWRGSTGGGSNKNNFGYKLAFLGQIVLGYADGTQEIIGTDETFRASYGPILKSDLKAGEIFDARINIDGWNRPGYDDFSWRNVNTVGDTLDNLIATRSVPVRRKERFKPEILKTPNGETVLDFGQNIAGWVEMKVNGPRGTDVTLIHGEALDKNGNFTLKNLGMFNEEPEDFQEVHYILRGEGVENYSPHFTFSGFQYVLLKNYPGEVIPENFTAVAIYSDMEQTGDFSCSNQLINQLVSNTRWSMKGNFIDIPTDCPTRERAGWTGDAQVFCKTATCFMNVYPFFEKWMADVSAEQYKNGCVGSTVPNVIGYHNAAEVERLLSKGPSSPMHIIPEPDEPAILDGSAGWGDAAVIIPWIIYLCYGDKAILERQFDTAKAWVDYMDACAKTPNEYYKDTPQYNTYTDGELDANYIWDTKFHWGEWLEADMDLGGSPEDMAEMFGKKMALSEPLVATAYYAYSSYLLSRMAGILGKKEEEEKYRKLFEKIKRVYNKYFIKDNGYILDDRQAPNVRVLAFNLADEGKKKAVADRLAELVKEKDYHLNTGFLSTPFILHVLVENGYKDIAFKLLEQTSCPSWLYAVTKGATTIWESWKGITPEGDVSGSLNHYSYGAVCDFLFSAVAGIRPDEKIPGYKHIIIKPVTDGTLTRASARYESIYGTVESGWEKTDKGIIYHLVIPPNTAATVMLPGSPDDVSRIKEEFKDTCYRDGRIVFETGSGEYDITI